MTIPVLLLALFAGLDDRPLVLDSGFGTDGVALVDLGPGDVDVQHLYARGAELHAITRVGAGFDTAPVHHRVDLATPLDLGQPQSPPDASCTVLATPRPEGSLLVLSATASQFVIPAASHLRVAPVPADPSFGALGGILLGPPRLYAPAMAVDLQGRIYLATHAGGSEILRYTAGGQPDASFGPEGARRFGPDDCARTFDLATDGDGRILVATADHCGARAELALFAIADGALDTTWGDRGWRRLSAGPDASGGPYLGRMLALRDGRVLVTHPTSEGTRVHALLPGGQIDTAFGDDGVVVHRSRFGGGRIRIAEGATGRIAIGLPSLDNSHIVVLERDGKIDATVGRSGVLDAPGARSSCSGIITFAALAVEDDGGLAYSRRPEDAERNTSVVRLDPLGRPRAGFGTGGELRFRGGHEPGRASRLFVDAASDAVAVATTARRAIPVGITSTGSLDGRFGEGGIVRPTYPVRFYPPLAAVDAAGRLLLHFAIDGDPFALSALDAGVHRFLRDGRPDPSFGHAAHALPPASYPLPHFTGLLTDGHSRVLLLGTQGENWQAVRFDASGTLDWGYGRAAVADIGTDLADTSVSPDGTLSVLRVDAHRIPRRLDRYGDSGELASSTAIEHGTGAPTSGMPRELVVFDDGSFALCATEPVGSGPQHVWRRYTAHGRLDPRYGSGGVVRVDATPFGTWMIVADREGTCRFVEQFGGNVRLSAVRADGTVEPAYFGASPVPHDLVLDTQRRLWMAGSRDGRIAITRTEPLP